MALLLFICAGAGVARASQQEVFNIDGFTIQDGLSQSGSSANLLPAAFAYSYLITGTCHGTGKLASEFPPGTSLATVVDTFQPGFSSNLQGVVTNPGGTLPFTVVSKTASGSLGGGLVTGAATFNVQVDATGRASFSITNVSITFFGSHDSSDTIVIDTGSVTTTAVLTPVVTTGTAASITGTSATLNGSVISNGDTATVSFDYGLDTTYGSTVSASSVPPALANSTPVGVAAPITGLVSGTTYHFRMNAANATGTANGADMTFDTPAVVESGSAPVAVTGTATNVTGTSATLNGTVNPEGADTSVVFEYGLTSSYGTTTVSQDAGSGSVTAPFSQAIGALVSGTTYHYRIDAVNTTGTSLGNDVVFNTPAVVTGSAPVAVTGTATSVTGSSATLNGTVNPDGVATTYTFEYGLTGTYGSATASVSAGSGTTAQAFNQAISSLVSGTTYHFRIDAVNTSGTSLGNDATFTTSAALNPIVTTLGVMSTGTSSVVLSGSVNPEGRDTTVSFQYGLDTTYAAGTTASVDVGSGTAAVVTTGTVSGLQPGTLYHYRAVATNGAVIVDGSDATITTLFQYAPYVGKFEAVFSGGSSATSGMATVSITAKGKFTAAVKADAKSLSLSGSFNDTGAATVSKLGATLAMQLGMTGGLATITGSMSGPVATEFVAQKCMGLNLPVNAVFAPYTVRIPHPADTTLPQGNGFGTLKISKTGAIRLTGKLGDGTAYTASTALLSNSTMVVYVPLYVKKQGCIVGTLTFESSVNGDLDGALNWFKPATAGAYTPEAIATSVNVFGSIYSKPPKGALVISSTSGNIELSNGDIVGGPLDTAAELNTSNKIIFPTAPADKLKVTISTATGLFSGSFLDTTANKTRKFYGALFQGTFNTGTGEFEGTTQAGEVDLFPRP